MLESKSNRLINIWMNTNAKQGSYVIESMLLRISADFMCRGQCFKWIFLVDFDEIKVLLLFFNADYIMKDENTD